MSFLYIDDDQALAELCQDLSRSRVLALDTEFIRERTYFPQLCLLQIAGDNAVACIDTLALSDLSPLKDLLLNPDILKVVHAGKQDMEIFFYLWQRAPSPLFDTQIAAAVLGYGEQIGYGALVQRVSGHHLSKTQSRTDWSRRPLSTSQLEYAADDVIYLLPVFHEIYRELEEKGRLAWLDDDFAELVANETYQWQNRDLWRKVKGGNRLKPKQLHLLRALTAWREEQAVQRDLPRRRVLSDDALIDIARSEPKTVGDLRGFRSIDSRALERYGQVMIEVLSRAADAPRSEWPQLPERLELDVQQEALVDLCSSVVKLTAHEQGISPGVLASRRDLEQLVAGETDIPVLSGWRRKLVGERLQAMVDGGFVLTWRDRRLSLALS